MKREQVFLRLPGESEGQAQWLRLAAEGGEPQLGQGSLAELTTQFAGAQITILVPSEDVLLTSLAMPTQNRQRLLKAVPYALEEQLVDDVEDLHFALGQRQGDQQLDVAVVSRKKMDEWQAQLREAGLVVEQLVPDVYLLPQVEPSWTACLEGERLLVRPNEGPAFVLEAANMAELLPLALREAGEPAPREMQLWDCRLGANHDATDFPVEPGWSVSSRACPRGLLSLLPNQGLDRFAINLLQGDYSRREQLGKLWRPWRLAASLALIGFLLHLGLAVVENSRLRAQNQALKAEAVKIYKDTFPDARKVVNPRVQMQRKLDELRGGETGSGRGLLEMLSSTGGILRKTRGLVLHSVRFKNGELNVEVEVASLQQLDELKQRLAGEAKMQVEIQSAAAKDRKVQGRLQIKSRPS